MTVDHIGKHSIPGNLCLTLLEKSGNFMWSEKWSPCIDNWWRKSDQGHEWRLHNKADAL